MEEGRREEGRSNNFQSSYAALVLTHVSVKWQDMNGTIFLWEHWSRTRRARSKVDALYLMKSERKSTRCWKTQPTISERHSTRMYAQATASPTSSRDKDGKRVLVPTLQQRKMHAAPNWWCRHKRKGSPKGCSSVSVSCPYMASSLDSYGSHRPLPSAEPPCFLLKYSTSLVAP